MLNPCPAVGCGTCGGWKTHSPSLLMGAQVLLIKAQPINSVRPIAASGALGLPGVAWECSPKRVVNSI